MHCLRTELHEIEKKFFWFCQFGFRHIIVFCSLEENAILLNSILCNTTQYSSIMLIGFTLSIINFLSCFMFFPNFSSTIDIFILNFTPYNPVFVSFLFCFCFIFVFIVLNLIFLSLKSEILPHLNLSYWILFYLFVSNFILFYIILLHDLIHLINCTLIYFLDSTMYRSTMEEFASCVLELQVHLRACTGTGTGTNSTLKHSPGKTSASSQR